MLKARKESQKSYINGDKLFINGQLWKEQDSAEKRYNSALSSAKKGYRNVLETCSWNISKGLLRKLRDGIFAQIMKKL